MYRNFITVLLVVLLLSTGTVFCQYGDIGEFYKNKVRDKHFDWYIFQTDHFDIYFYPEESEIIKDVAGFAEEAYFKVCKHLRHNVKNRIPLIIYQSHTEFEQTNVIFELLNQNVGGFTEAFKNRVVVPVTGSRKWLREVVTHEFTHALVYDMFLGAFGFVGIQKGTNLPPLWFMEGLAEYEAEAFDGQSDMVMRDIVLNGKLFPFYRLDEPDAQKEVNMYAVIYKQSSFFIKYLCGKYGEEKIADVLLFMKIGKPVDSAFESAFGKSFAELYREWEIEVKRKYFPLVDKKVCNEFADPVDVKMEKSWKYMPKESPDGSMLGFVSNHKGNQICVAVYADSSVRKTDKFYMGEFDDINLGGSVFNWSYDGRKICFVGNKNARNVLLVLDVAKEEIVSRIYTEFANVRSPAWMKHDSGFVVSCLEDGYYSICFIDTAGKTVRKISEGKHDCNNPVLSADGKKLAYEMESDYKRDIVVVDMETMKKELIITSENDNYGPCFGADGLYYISDRTGIPNVYVFKFGENAEYRITDALVGITSVSYSETSQKLFLTEYYDGFRSMYGISMEKSLRMERMTEKKPESVGLSSVGLSSAIKSSGAETGKLETRKSDDKRIDEFFSSKLDIFGWRDLKDTEFAMTDKTRVNANQVSRWDVSGDSQKYIIRVTPDWVFANMVFGAYTGLQFLASFGFSDILGDHRLVVEASGMPYFSDAAQQTPYYPGSIESQYRELYYFLSGIDYSSFDARFTYLFSKWRPSVGVTMFNVNDYHPLITDYSVVARDRYSGGGALISYPLNVYDRLDLKFESMDINTEYYGKKLESGYNHLSLLTLAYVEEATLYGGVLQGDGWRKNVAVEYSDKYLGGRQRFVNIVTDLRRYFVPFQGIEFALRGLGGISMGPDRWKYYVGGIDTIRGYGLGAFPGDKFFVLNGEVRFPVVSRLDFVPGFIDYVIMVDQIQLVGLVDAGNCWFEWNVLKISDVKMGVGFGTRIHALLFSQYFTILRFDYARRTDVDSPFVFYFSLGNTF